METKFNFKSQICTSQEQSERLLALSLKKETADIVHYFSQSLAQDWTIVPLAENETAKNIEGVEIPAWSLHRLIEMMPDIIKDPIDEMLYHLSIDGNSVFYENRSFDLCQFFGDNLYVCIIDCIEWLIKEEYFNKKYLEE